MISYTYEIYKVLVAYHEGTLNIFRVSDTMMEDKTYKQLKIESEFNQQELNWLENNAPILSFGRSYFDMLDGGDEDSKVIASLSLVQEIKQHICNQLTSSKKTLF